MEWAVQCSLRDCGRMRALPVLVNSTRSTIVGETGLNSRSTSSVTDGVAASPFDEEEEEEEPKDMTDSPRV